MNAADLMMMVLDVGVKDFSDKENFYENITDSDVFFRVRATLEE